MCDSFAIGSLERSGDTLTWKICDIGFYINDSEKSRYYSEKFQVHSVDWEFFISPRGDFMGEGHGRGKFISVYAKPINYYGREYVEAGLEFILKNKNPESDLSRKLAPVKFSSKLEDYGIPRFMDHHTLYKEGYVHEGDTIKVELKIDVLNPPLLEPIADGSCLKGDADKFRIGVDVPHLELSDSDSESEK